MGFSNTDQSVTVDSTERTYKTAFVPKYAAALAKNNTVCKKTDITDGTSVWRLSHDEQSGQSRHLLSIEDNWLDGDGVPHNAKVHVVAGHTTGDILSEQRAEDLGLGLASYLTTAVLASLMDGEM